MVFSDCADVEIVPVDSVSPPLHLLCHVGHSATQLVPVCLKNNTQELSLVRSNTYIHLPTLSVRTPLK